MYVKSHFDSFDLHYPPDPLFENSLPNYFSNYLKSLKISHVPFMRDNDIIFKPKKWQKSSLFAGEKKKDPNNKRYGVFKLDEYLYFSSGDPSRAFEDIWLIWLFMEENRK